MKKKSQFVVDELPYLKTTEDASVASNDNRSIEVYTFPAISITFVVGPFNISHLVLQEHHNLPSAHN